MVRSFARASCGLVLLVTVGAACRTQAGSGAATRPVQAHRRIVLVGIDAADWLALDPLIEAGKVPTFARLRRGGRTGVLVSTPPLVSPILWTTISTGRSPEDHGVLDFMAELPSAQLVPVSSSERRVPALWNFFSEAGRSVGVVGWWATWPVEPVRGTMVSDRVAPQLLPARAELGAGAIGPEEARARLAPAVVRAEDVSFEDLRAYIPLTTAEHAAAQATLRRASSPLYEDPLAHLAAVVAATRTYTAMAETLLRSGQPDLLAVYFEAVDTVSHLFIRDARRGPSAIEQAYREADAMLKRLATASAPDTLFIVCSDHGFQPASAAVMEDPADLTGPATAWHRPYGLIASADAGVLAGGTPPFAAPAPVGPAGLLDVAPTVLHAAGLPIGAEMPGRPLMELLPSDAAARPIERRPSPPRRMPASSQADAARTPDPAAVARLQALGYVGTRPTSLARQNLGEILYRAGRLPAAERVLRTAVEAQPHNPAAQLWLARTLADQGRPGEALRVYEQALSLPGGAQAALVTAVELALSSGDRATARRLWRSARVTPATRVPLHVARGALASAEGRLVEAERELRKAVALDATSFEALSRLLDLLIPRRGAQEALPMLRRAAVLASGSPRHLALFGAGLLAAGDARGAENPLASALALAPDSAAVRTDLARAQLAQGKAEQARAVLAPAPASADRSVLLGTSYARQERWKEAAGHFKDAVQRAAPTPDRLNGLGWAHHKLGQDEEAARLLRRSLELDAEQPQIRALLARIEGKRVAR